MKKTELHCIGFWCSDETECEWYIDPNLLINHDYKGEKEKILNYLNQAQRINIYMGFSYCRIGDEIPDEEMGNADKTDGYWIWPEGLAVYVDRFNVKLPAEFISYMAEQDFQCPVFKHDDIVKLEELPVNDLFWTGWCSGMNSMLGRTCVMPWWHEDDEI